MFLKFVFLVRPLGKELYAGAIDACGGKVLANILPLVWRQTFLFRDRKKKILSVYSMSVSPQIKHSGTVSACGLAAGMPLPTTVIVLIFKKSV